VFYSTNGKIGIGKTSEIYSLNIYIPWFFAFKNTHPKSTTLTSQFQNFDLQTQSCKKLWICDARALDLISQGCRVMMCFLISGMQQKNRGKRYIV
jgi:hypothetical protein